jgi:TPR repeat protein
MSKEISQLKEDVSKQYNTNDSLTQEIRQVREQNAKQLKMIDALNRENRNLQNSFSSSYEKKSSHHPTSPPKQNRKPKTEYGKSEIVNALKSEEQKSKAMEEELKMLKQQLQVNQNISEPVRKGMNLLKENPKEAAQVLKQAADNGDIEACWRIAACYNKGIGIPENWENSKIYAEKAMKSKSLDGIFWYGSSCTSRTEGFKYYKEAADKGHLASKWWVGWCQFCGYGTDKNEFEGKKKMESVALSGDSYWTTVQANIFENGWYGFPRDKIKRIISANLRVINQCVIVLASIQGRLNFNCRFEICDIEIF